MLHLLVLVLRVREPAHAPGHQVVLQHLPPHAGVQAHLQQGELVSICSYLKQFMRAIHTNYLK